MWKSQLRSWYFRRIDSCLLLLNIIWFISQFCSNSQWWVAFSFNIKYFYSVLEILPLGAYSINNDSICKSRFPFYLLKFIQLGCFATHNRCPRYNSTNLGGNGFRPTVYFNIVITILWKVLQTGWLYWLFIDIIAIPDLQEPLALKNRSYKTFELDISLVSNCLKSSCSNLKLSLN